MTLINRHISVAFGLIIFTLTSCSELKTSDAEKTFKYWAGTPLTSDVELLNGQYWQSGHWTKEYIMYLKLKPSKLWWNEFLKQNSLTTDTTKWIRPDDAPKWFKPTENSIQFGQTGFSQGSRYFNDTITGVCYIYEIQL